MAAKRIKRKPKRRPRAAKGRAKSRRRNVRSGAGAKSGKTKSRGKRASIRGTSQKGREQLKEFFADHEPDFDDKPPIDYDEEDIEEYADLWGVSYEEAEAVLEESTDVFANVPLDDYGRPDIDYMSELADLFDVEVSDLYDLYYGCTPGSSE